MDEFESIRTAYRLVVREFEREADVLVRREAPRQRLLSLCGESQSRLGWSNDRLFDWLINERKHNRLPPKKEILGHN